jgi:ribose/xylose/arabinose/galactoside ABC-type transport system permease subunit
MTLAVPETIKDKSRWVSLLRANGLIVFFVVLIVVFSIIKPEFASMANLRNILASSSVMGILAVGQTLVVLTGGFDLGVAKTAALAGLVVLLGANYGPVVAIALVAVVTAVIGLVDGLLVAKGKVAPFVVTLGMYTMLGSVALLVNNGESLNDRTDWLRPFTDFNIASIPGIVFWFAAIAIGFQLILSHTRYGRQIMAVGGNHEAARLAGIRADRTVVSTYVLCSLLAGIGGILLTSRLHMASPVALPSVELDAMAAVIIGGTRMSGGFGSIWRTVLGVLVLYSLTSGLVLLGVAAYWQGILKGAIIIIAVFVDVVLNTKKK